MPPQANRAQLQQIIAGLNDGVILINPDRTIAWANEMALQLHGADDAAALGMSVSDYRDRFELRYRNQERVAEDESPIERLIRGETLQEIVIEVRRANDARRWIHQIRTMILTDAAGQPDCYVVIINDETERFNAEERFERAFGANPAPAIIARLSDLRYVKVNHGFLELTGYKRDELIGRSMHEFDVLAGADRRSLAVERLHAGQTIPQMEGCLALPGDLERTVLLGGQPIEIGDEACMLFTFADLHPRQQAQHALRHSEERFAKAFHMAPGPMAILALDGLRILDVNSAFTAVTRWRREEVIGRAEAELDLLGGGPARERNTRMLRETGHLQGVDVEFRAKNGAVGYFLLSAETVDIHGAPCVLIVMLDITERKQTEMDLLSAVQSVMQDTSWLSQRIVERLAAVGRPDGAASDAPEVLSLPKRGREVLDCIAQGLADEDIALQLGISKNTVRNHVSAIYDRLKIRKRAAVVAWARERGLGVPVKLRKTGSKSRRPSRD